jgi:hypothetical protein
MRRDATIDRRKVKCLNASHIGYGKLFAQVGDIITFSYPGGETRTARMVGRIHYAPALQGDKSPVRDFILAAMLNPRLDHVGEFWIDPKTVLTVESVRDHLARVNWFFSPELVKEPIDEVRETLSEGWTDIYALRKWRAGINQNRRPDSQLPRE